MRRYAPHWMEGGVYRGLKPTATLSASLRDAGNAGDYLTRRHVVTGRSTAAAILANTTQEEGIEIAIVSNLAQVRQLRAKNRNF